jgi:hypothetical protein
MSTHLLALWIHAVDTGIARLREAIGDATLTPALVEDSAAK